MRFRRHSHCCRLSHSPSTTSYSSNSQLQTVFVTSLKDYEEKTLLTHPLMSHLQACSAPTDILAVLRNQVQHFEQSTTGGFLLDRGVNAIAEDKDRWTPLHLTSLEGQIETVRMLLDRGVSADSINKDERTPLYLAPSSGKADIVRLLLDHGASVDAKDNEGRTPFELASGWQRTQILRVLTEHGANAEGEP